jgi:serine/threonine protein kinase
VTDSICPNCATALPTDARFCPSCGAITPTGDREGPLETEPPAPPEAEDQEFLEQLRAALGDAYELGEAIGQGGFGRVYRARDRRLERAVAIKAIRPDLAGARVFLDRFRREGIALAKLRHPGIVPIYDIRESRGLICCVMPFIAGENLRAKVQQRGRLAPKEVQRILSELCDSVAAAHRAGIVHRDIKPDNVILEGHLGKVLLMDFGIAKSQSDFEVTASGMLVGTPTYMAPEQASGEIAIDHRADIYSLGVLGYHLLTGNPPFTGRTAQEILVQHVTSRPVPIRRLNHSVPKVLADAIERCLQKDPAQRFDSVMELWGQLQRVNFFPEAAPPPPTSFAARNSYLAGWLAVMALASALYGTAAISTLPSWSFFALAGLFAILAALLSPTLREAIDIRGGVREIVRQLIRGLTRRSSVSPGDVQTPALADAPNPDEPSPPPETS